MALLSVEGHCDSDAGILVGMPFEGRHCGTIGQIHQVCRAEFPLDRLVRRPCTLPGGQRCAPGAPSDHSRAPIASEGANRPATGLQTCTRQRGHRPQPRQVRRKPDRSLTKHTPTDEQRQVPDSCGSAPTGLCHRRIPPPSPAMVPGIDSSRRRSSPSRPRTARDSSCYSCASS